MTVPQELECWQVFGEQIATARKQRHWSVRELADRIRELGFDGPSEKRISHIEAGSRQEAPESVRQRAENIRLREAIALAAALGPALPNLLAPIESAAPPIRLGNLVLDPDDYRSWLLGLDREPLGGDGDDRKLYAEFVPRRWHEQVERDAAEAARPNEPSWLTLARLEPSKRRQIVSGGTIVPQGDFAQENDT